MIAARMIRRVTAVFLLLALPSAGLAAQERPPSQNSRPRQEPRSSQDRPPNFVLIFTDDQGYQDVGCFGSPKIETPNLDRMAAQGMRFTAFYSGAPVCSASRAALLTGSYCDRVGVTGVFYPNRKRQGLHPDEETIAEVLKRRGYATACIGKWHLGDEPEFLPTRQGFDSYFGIPYSNDMSIRRGGKTGPPLMRDEKIVEHPADLSTLTRRYTEEALQFVARNAARPFFLYLAHTMPHVPLAASPDFRGKSARGLYGDAVEELDASVGRLLAALRRRGIDQNTLVVFTSDNGPWLAKGADGGCALPLRDGKFTAFEGGMRVPCIARWPGTVPAGRTCDEVAATIDVLPTFAALAGARRTRGRAIDGTTDGRTGGTTDGATGGTTGRTIGGTTDGTTGRTIDGRSIVALLRGVDGAKSPHDAYFYNRDVVRSGRWKLMLKGRSTVKDRPAGPFPALYDLRADVSETIDLASAHPRVVARLTSLLKAHRADIRRNRRPVGQAQPPEVGPRVLILGDSISIGYTPKVREMLWGEAQVFRPMRTDARGRRSPENCAGTDKGVANIDRWLAADGGKWDIIHFNFGLHDMKHVDPETGRNSTDPKHPRQTSPDEYRRQLAAIVDKLQRTGAKLVFATTTPFPKGVRPLRDPTDVARYNAAARDVMQARGIAIDDLCAFVKPRLKKLQQPVNVHFKPGGSAALARRVVECIRAAGK